MKRLFQISLCVICMCFTVSLTLQTNFLIPKWLRRFSNENYTGIPKSIVQLQNNAFYPARKLLMNLLTSQQTLDLSRKLQRTQKQLEESTNFYCSTIDTRSSTRPTSVHELRPGDIDVIGSIGDSLSVGSGSFSLFLPQIFVDFRGVSFSGGGQGTWREFLTLPNILKAFNPNLIGYAFGVSQAQDVASQFNVAEIGALSQDLPFMTREFVKRIKIDKRVDFNEDWKLVTIMMGSNTFCLDLCYDDSTQFVERHRNEVVQALLYLKENLPRTIVNLVLSPNLKILLEFTNLPEYCSYTHILECPCLYATQYKHRKLDYIDVMRGFQKVEKEIVELEVMKDRDDFSVVLQTFTEHLIFPVNRFNTTDLRYLAADCFHFSQKGYARAANALWNNMLEPVGRKSTDWTKEFDKFLCPSEKSPYIRTWKNSLV